MIANQLGGIISSAGAVFIVISLTLVRYQFISGNSHAFAVLQITGATCLALSTYWQFNLGTLLLQSYCVLMTLHTIYLNHKRQQKHDKKNSRE